jgi:hypothetical protein
MPIKYDDKGLIKRPDKKINYTQEMIVEWAQCIQSVIYFAENYYYVVHPTQGSQKIVLRPYQKNMVDIFQNHRFSLINSARQIGKCLHKDMLITIRNKNTGKIQEISIYELFKAISNLQTFPE